MKFIKLHGQGNDFLVTPAETLSDPASDYAETAKAICERHYGVGADGAIWVCRSAKAGVDFEVRLFNCDGSEAEISGNGIRCVAAYLHHCSLTRKESLSLHTAAGVKTLRLLERRGEQYRFESDMGPPILKPGLIPIVVSDSCEPVVQYPLMVGGERISITATSMGNPHCAVFSDSLDESRINQLGPLLENHAAFPRRTNVEFVQVLSRRAIALRLWERGVGRTLSSGTGSSSAVVASILNGFTDDQVTVHTLAGPLEVEWRGRDHIYLTGPAEVIFSGEYRPTESGIRRHPE